MIFKIITQYWTQFDSITMKPLNSMGKCITVFLILLSFIGVSESGLKIITDTKFGNIKPKYNVNFHLNIILDPQKSI